MRNHTTKLTQVPNEINVISIFLKFGMVKLFKSLHNAVDVKLTTSYKIFQ